ncbi:hypothetical protein R3P38DRAFT_964890 [Favolaschia claudopus]|uniref:Secreted protein n=1 Tax=Favolaschia claudopus TaxID=2862362 RepID=A0AAW0E5L3_9AGAR
MTGRTSLILTLAFLIFVKLVLDPWQTLLATLYFFLFLRDFPPCSLLFYRPLHRHFPRQLSLLNSNPPSRTVFSFFDAVSAWHLMCHDRRPVVRTSHRPPL